MPSDDAATRAERVRQARLSGERRRGLVVGLALSAIGLVALVIGWNAPMVRSVGGVLAVGGLLMVARNRSR
jgi:hypothetical protein